MRRKECCTLATFWASEVTKLNFAEAQQLQNEQLQLKNVRSHKDDDNLISCPDCGQLMKKKCMLAHSQSHVGHLIVGEEVMVSYLDSVRKHKRDSKTFACPEDDKKFVHRM